MATANFDRYDLGFDGADLGATRTGDNVREDLSDLISNIAPYVTPCQSAMASGRARNTYTEWQTDGLAAVDPNNAVVDGADATGLDTDPSERMGNHCQILDKVIRVSGRAEVVDKAGRRSEMAYQLMKAGRSIKRDLEAIITANQGSVAGDGTTAARMGGMIPWMVTNASLGATGVLGGYSAGTITAHTFGTDRALTEAMIRQGAEDAYTQGGEPTVLQMAPAVKVRVSEYMYSSSARVATLYRDTQGEGNSAATAQGSVDVFVSDFGPLTLQPNRFWGHNGTVPDESYIAGLQMDLWALLWLRSYRTNKLARTGDAENRQLICDVTVRATNEAGNFLIADLNTDPMSAS